MTIRPWWLWGLGIIGIAVVALLAVIAYALLSDDGDGSEAEVGGIAQGVTPTLTATPRVTPSPTPPAATPEPSPTPCPDCPGPTSCPEPTVCPTCPAPAQCTPCPSAPDSLAEDCAAIKAGIEARQVFLDIAQKRGLIGMTESEARTNLEKSENTFDQMCQGVVLAKPSLLTAECALAAKWKGSLQEENLHAPDPQNTVWVNQLEQIIDRYCMPEY